MFISESGSNSILCMTPKIFLFFSLFSSSVIQVTCHPLILVTHIFFFIETLLPDVDLIENKFHVLRLA